MGGFLRSPADLGPDEIRRLYAGFEAPICELDCGRMCAPRNPNGKPFCCDICHAVPAVYESEWSYLRDATDLWHPWRGDECAAEKEPEKERARLQAELPPGMILLACKGPAECQRAFRSLGCRQFPFYPYVSADYRFLGLAGSWEFEAPCWVLEHLEVVSEAYRSQFVQTYDRIFALFQEEFENYAWHSERARRYYAAWRRRFALLHRNGGLYMVSPGSGRMNSR